MKKANEIKNGMMTVRRDVLSKLPEVLWILIFKFCNIKDFSNLRQVSKKLKLHADNYPDIYERECLRLFTTDLVLFR